MKYLLVIAALLLVGCEKKEDEPHRDAFVPKPFACDAMISQYHGTIAPGRYIDITVPTDPANYPHDNVEVAYCLADGTCQPAPGYTYTFGTNLVRLVGWADIQQNPAMAWQEYHVVATVCR